MTPADGASAVPAGGASSAPLPGGSGQIRPAGTTTGLRGYTRRTEGRPGMGNTHPYLVPPREVRDWS